MNQSVLLASMALVALSGCNSDKRPLAPVSPVVVIGIDGVDPGVLNELLAAGRVPSFQRFADDGTLGRLGTFAPTWSPVIWTTIATGQDANTHGVNDFLEADSGKPYTSNTRRVPAIWNLASNAGRTVDCVGWWITWPAEPVNGRLVASYAAQAQAKIIWKPTLWKEM
ncbi:MAG: alkaline phosphatase family protein, partial [Planctomycetota bacterium]|nr:alkaline phosphatase family protein [Planctomycetota bacterium]